MVVDLTDAALIVTIALVGMVAVSGFVTVLFMVSTTCWNGSVARLLFWTADDNTRLADLFQHVLEQFVGTAATSTLQC